MGKGVCVCGGGGGGGAAIKDNCTKWICLIKMTATSAFTCPAPGERNARSIWKMCARKTAFKKTTTIFVCLDLDIRLACLQLVSYKAGLTAEWFDVRLGLV